MIFVRKHFQLIVATLIAFMLSVLPRVVFGQDVPEEITGPQGSGALQIFWMIVQYGGGALAISGIGWGLTRLALFINERFKTEAWAGFVVRFIQALDDAFEAAWEKFEASLSAARDPKSDGGTVVTEAELSTIGDDMLEHLKTTYVSLESLSKLASRIIGGDGEAWIKKKITNKVKSGVTAKLRGPRIETTVNP